MKPFIFIWSSFVMVGVFLSITLGGPAFAGKKAAHPTLSEQEKLTPCADCHKTVTPKVYNEWFESTHGVANVKCFQCHGTYEELKTVPDVNRCAVCHAEAFSHAEDKVCWSCHKAHGFKIRER